MSIPALREITERWIGLWCVPVDWDLFDKLHDEAFKDCASAGRPNDRKGFSDGLKAFISAFPDLMTKIDDMVVDQDKSKVAVRWTARGTNHLSYLGIGPTLKPTEIRGIEIIEVRAGKIIRRWGEWDISDHRADT